MVSDFTASYCFPMILKTFDMLGLLHGYGMRAAPKCCNCSKDFDLNQSIMCNFLTR